MNVLHYSWGGGGVKCNAKSWSGFTFDIKSVTCKRCLVSLGISRNQPARRGARKR